MTGSGAADGARSCLFAPGVDERKMTKAAATAADVVILDIEDAVAEAAKPDARAAIASFLAGAGSEERGRLWVRINALDGARALADLAEAREIVVLFASEPDIGTIGHHGTMLDRPHLARAQSLLHRGSGP